MKHNRYAAFAILLFVFILIQFVYPFTGWEMLILMSISFGIVWIYADKKDELLARKENKELQEKIKSTAKDAHLKNKQLLTIVSSIPFPLLLLDQYGNIVMSNNIDEISNQAPFKQMTYIKNNLVYPVQEFIKDSFIMERPMDTILRIQDIEYQSISIPVTAKKHYRGCLLLFQDVSKTLEGEKMQKRFIADASHELKTPISIIKGMVEILNREAFDDDALRFEFLTQIESEINRLDILVKDLLQLSRLSLSTVILKKEQNDMIAIINKAIHSLHKQAHEKGIRIVCNYQYKEMVHCDAMKMSQVMLNLISNAIKYSEHGTITIETEKRNSFFLIRVRDEGRGIAPENIEKIFERFYRVDDDRSRKNGGSGLGLPIVKSTVEAHGGQIEVESEFHKGSTFTIKIPI